MADRSRWLVLAPARGSGCLPGRLAACRTPITSSTSRAFACPAHFLPPRVFLSRVTARRRVLAGRGQSLGARAVLQRKKEPPRPVTPWSVSSSLRLDSTEQITRLFYLSLVGHQRLEQMYILECLTSCVSIIPRLFKRIDTIVFRKTLSIYASSVITCEVT